jgi:hypothetical protein
MTMATTITNKLNISSIYNQIYSNKFTRSQFLFTMSGYIFSKPVYLDIDDIDLNDGLYTILEFYKKIEKIENMLSIKLNNIDCPVSKKHLEYCSICHGEYHSPLIIMNDNKICSNCTDIDLDTIENYVFSKPVIFNFNLYEWIPIHKNILENRNPNSSLYKRKIIIYTNHYSIELYICDLNNSNQLDHNSLLFNYCISEIFKKYQVKKYLDDKILKFIDFKIKNNVENKKYDSIIISE